MYPPVLSIDGLVHHFRPLPGIALISALYSLAAGRDLLPGYVPVFVFLGLYVIFKLGAFLDHRIAWGSPRRMTWDDEVVVITGGSSGLGRVLANSYAMRGVSVAVLDIRPWVQAENDSPSRKGEGSKETNYVDESNVHFYHVDIGDEEAVLKAKVQITRDLGSPTILINNAGIVNGKTLLELDSAALERNFRVNLLSHFYTIRAFLPAMIDQGKGTIVTVASVLGDLGGSHLSDYGAAKAGLIAMHTSLRSELADGGHDHIKTILVKPGQLSTPLFEGVKTPNSFVGPVIEAVDLAQRILKKIESGDSGVIAMPLYAEYIEWLSVLPYGLQRFGRWLSGVDRAMRSFRGS